MDFIDEIEAIYKSKKQEAEQALLNGTNLETYYKWTLKRHTQKYSSMASPIRGTEEVLSNGFTDEYICNLLNKENIFDFEYQPLNNDVILIKEHYKHLKLETNRPILSQKNEMNFCYENGHWTIGGYKNYNVYNTINKGLLKTILPTKLGTFTLISKQKEVNIWSIQKNKITITVKTATETPTTKQINFIKTINEHLSDISKKIRKKFQDEFIEIGVLDNVKSWNEFTINEINLLSDFNPDTLWQISFQHSELNLIFLIENEEINNNYKIQ
jgi:hypothetical protein